MFSVEKDEPGVVKVTADFAQVCEGSLTPDVWQNIISEDELDDDCSNKFHGQKDVESSDLRESPLLGDFSFNHEIPEWIASEKLLLS